MKAVHRIFRLPVLCAAYSGLITLWYLAWLFIGDANWWLVMLNRFAAYLLFPPLILLLLAIVSRKMRLALPLFVPALIFILIYHPYLVPRPAKPFDGTDSLKVMTYNVLYSNTDYDAVANVILTHQPDLVSLQEVVPGMMDALVDRLQAEYPYHRSGTPDDYGETAVFSRYPITDSQVLELQPDRRAVVVKVEFHEQNITFVSIHLLAYNLWWTKLKDIPAAIMERTSIQNHQAQLVLNQAGEEQGIFIVGCDCNSQETASSYRVLDEGLENAARAVGLRFPGTGFPGARQDISLTHIDYVWYAGDIDPVRVYKILDAGGSDHLPVLAIFSMR